ncbi:MAG: YciI-like protein [Chloroflexi bacterium]|nr:YciI-like protein [Chloroflexota bacterium]
MATTRYVLLYDYVENVVEKRAPFRAGHLALANEYVERGDIEMAGAFADPVDGAAFVFTVEDRARVQAFVAADPYVANGLVTSWRIKQWTVVVGGD